MAIIDQLYEFGGDLKMTDDAGNDIMDYAERNANQESAVKKWLMINGIRPKDIKSRGQDESSKNNKAKGDNKAKNGDKAKKGKKKARDSDDEEDKKSKSCSVM